MLLYVDVLTRVFVLSGIMLLVCAVVVWILWFGVCLYLRISKASESRFRSPDIWFVMAGFKETGIDIRIS